MALKTCVHCGETKDETEFVWRNKSLGRRWGTCRTCQSEQRRDWYERNKEKHVANVYRNKLRKAAEARAYVWRYLESHPCVDCGISNPVVLEFDHIRGTKVMAVSEMVGQGYPIEMIQREIDKCVVRCANCHREKTFRERGWFAG